MTEALGQWLAWGVLGTMVVLVIAANVSSYLRRQKQSPKERATEDKESEEEMRVW